MPSEELLIRVSVDAKDAVAGAGQAKTAIREITDVAIPTTTALAKSSDVSSQLTKSLGRLASAGRMDVFKLLVADVARTTTGMTNLGQASGLLRTGIFGLQSTLGVFMGPLGLAGVAVAGMGLISIFTGIKNVQKDLSDEINKAKEPLTFLIENFTQWADLAKSLLIYSLKQTEIELIKNEAAIRKLQEEGAKPTFWENLLKIIGLLYSYKGIDVPAMVDAEVKSEERLNSELLKLLRTEAELLKQKTALKEAIEPPKVKGWTDVNEAMKMQLLLLKTKFPKPRDLFKPMELKPITKTFDTIYVTGDKVVDDLTDRFEKFKNDVRYYVGDLFTAFVDMMSGVDVRWGDLLESMVKQLVASGLEKMIMKLLTAGFGGGFLGSIFGSFGGLFGLQKGTSFVPFTAPYILHRGEAVIPAERNIYNSTVLNQQRTQNIQNFYVINLDPKKLTKKEIAPALKAMIKNREFKI